MNQIILKQTQLFALRSIRAASIMSFKDDTGSAGAIREAGGAFGKLGAAREADYFHKKQVEQLRDLSHKDVTSDEFQNNKMDKFTKKDD